MAELLVKAVSASVPTDPDRDVLCYKRGMPVVVMPDGHPWGARERRPRFVVIKFPGVSVERLQRYIEEWRDGDPDTRRMVRRRVWRLRWDDLPTRARNRLRDDGELIIQAGTRDVPDADYTWDQVKSYLRDELRGVDESEAM